MFQKNEKPFMAGKKALDAFNALFKDAMKMQADNIQKRIVMSFEAKMNDARQRAERLLGA